MNGKNILIAFDGSENSLRAVDYVARMVASCEGVSVTLLHVEMLPDRDMYPDREEWEAVCKEREARKREDLQRGTVALVAGGMDREAVASRYLPHCQSPFHDRTDCAVGAGVAGEVLRVREELDCGTVVVGRKGVSRQEEFLFGSVSSRIVREAQGCTVWVVN